MISDHKPVVSIFNLKVYDDELNKITRFNSSATISNYKNEKSSTCGIF